MFMFVPALVLALGFTGASGVCAFTALWDRATSRNSAKRERDWTISWSVLKQMNPFSNDHRKRRHD